MEQGMEKKANIHNSLRRVLAEYKEIALVAIFPTLAVWVNIYMSIIWVVALYLGCLLLIMLIYIFMDYTEDDEESEEDFNKR